MKKIIGLFVLLLLAAFGQKAQAQCSAKFTAYVSGLYQYGFVDSSVRYYNVDYWDFGDGQVTFNNTGQLWHRYAKPGSYDVCRIIWDSTNSCRDTFCQTVVIASCKADFSFRVSGDTVQFADASSPTPRSYYWTFGDGGSSNAANPMHIYKASSSNQTFTVCLSISDSSWTCQDKVCYTVTIPSTITTCDASFDATKTLNNVIFKAADRKGLRHDWSFGDGTSANNGGDSLLHIYPKPKGPNDTTYLACLIVSDSINSCTDTVCKAVVISNDTCQVSFTTRAVGSTVYFTNTSTVTAYSKYHWSLGNGYTTTGPHAIFTYKPGKYTVCLTVTDTLLKCNVKTSCVTVKIDSFTSCDATFSSQSTNNVTTFVGPYSSNQSYLYSWDFGDGGTSTNRMEVHTYKKPATNRDTTYYACLIVRDTLTNCSDSFCKAIVVSYDSCQVSFYASTVGNQVYFGNTSTLTKTSKVLWNFGNGDTSAVVNPTYTFASPGTYNVCLIVTDSNQTCKTNYYCAKITIRSSTNCQADYTYTVTNDSIVDFKNISVGTNTYSWNYAGSNGGDTTKDLRLIFKKSGTYTVCLFAYNYNSGYKCGDTVCKNINITINNNKCRPSFRVALDTTQKFKMYLLNGSSKASTHQYYWTFGDGGTSTSRNPNHTYKSFGKFHICLTISDSSLNCSSTFCDSIGMDSTGKLLKAQQFELEVIDDFLAVKKVDVQSYKVYPNPTSDKVKIELTDWNVGAEVHVMSMDGKRIMTRPLDETGEIELNLSDQKNGIYILQIFDGKTYSQTKLIKWSN